MDLAIVAGLGNRCAALIKSIARSSSVISDSALAMSSCEGAALPNDWAPPESCSLDMGDNPKDPAVFGGMGSASKSTIRFSSRSISQSSPEELSR